MSDRPVTQQELRRSTGEHGTPRFVACDGIVYDLTGCPNWRLDLHRGLHFAGQDLTGELGRAPHGRDVFRRPCVRRVGPLVP